MENGAEVVQVFDSWAGMLPEGPFRRWVIEPTATIVRELGRTCPSVPVIGFPRGSGVLVQSYVEETGVDGVGIDSVVPVGWAREALQKNALVQGNLDNVLLMAGGDELERACARILDGLAEGRFIFNLGHGVLPSTPPEHVARVSAAVKNWRQTTEDT